MRLGVVGRGGGLMWWVGRHHLFVCLGFFLTMNFLEVSYQGGEFLKTVVNFFGMVNKIGSHQSVIIRNWYCITIDHCNISEKLTGVCLE